MTGTETDGGVVGRYRWVVCALLFFATTVNYVDRQILALIKEFLDAELGWTNEQFGLVNSVFQGAYAVGLLAFGWFVDRFGTKLGYAVSIVMWSIAAISHAAVGSVRGFFAARMFLGVSEGGNFPSAIKAVALWFPKRERAFATAIFNSGTNVGAIIAPMLIPAIALTLGWRWAFIFAGIAGFLWLLVWIPFYDVPAKAKRLKKPEYDLIHSDKDEQAAGQPAMSWIGSLNYRETWSFIVAKALTDPVWWFYLIWLPDYFKATRGLVIKNSWYYIVTIYTIVTVLSIAGGWLTGHLNKLGWSVTRARKAGMFLFALCVVPVLAVTKVGDWPAVLLIGFAAAAHQAWSANLFTTVSDMFPKRAVATVVGIGGMAGAIGGVMFPWLTGKLLDEFTSKGNVTQGYALLFGICAFAYLVTFAVHHLLAPKFQQVTVVDGTRLGRLPFFLSWLAVQAIAATLARLVTGSWAPTLAYSLVAQVASLAGIAVLAVGRFHDLGRSGHHYWLLFLPFYNVYVFLLLLLKRGTVGPNAYGADPLTRGQAA